MPDIACSTCKGLQQAISQLAGVSFDSQTGLFCTRVVPHFPMLSCFHVMGDHGNCTTWLVIL